MNHLQGDAQDQLHQEVEGDVEVSRVDKHVGDEPPDLPFLLGVKNQDPNVDRSVGAHGLPLVGQGDDVPDENT